MSAKIAATDMAAPTWLVSARIVDAWAIERSAMALRPTTVTGIITRPTPMPCTAREVVIHASEVDGVMNALPAAPININVKPVTAGRRAPMRSTSRPPIAMLTAVSTAEGVRITPTFNALYPRNFSNCNGTNTARVYCGTVMSAITNSDPAKTGVFARWSSSSGADDRVAWRAKSASSTIPATMQPSVAGASQPQDRLWARAKMKNAKPDPPSVRPSTSSEPCSRAGVPTNNRRPTMAPAIPIGTLGRNSQCQLTAVTR